MCRVREEILPYLKTGANNISLVQKVSLINFKLLRIGMNIFHTILSKIYIYQVSLRHLENDVPINGDNL